MDSFGKRLTAALKSAGMSQADLARRLGIKQQSVNYLCKPTARKSGYTTQIAAILGENPEWLATGKGPRTGGRSASSVPIVGYVGAGAEIVPFDDHAKGQGMDEAPPFPGQDGPAVAVRVRGESMLPQLEDGWLLYYSRPDGSAGVPDDCLNRLCVVQVDDGPMLVKRLERGRRKGLWRLVSTNASPRDDVRLDWAARVRAIVP